MLPVPKLTIGSYSTRIPLPEQEFIWRSTCGELPFIGEIIVPRTIAKQVEQLENPVSIEIVVDDSVQPNINRTKTLKFLELHLIDYHIIDDFNIQYRIADARWLFQGKRVTKEYNVTLRNNQNVAAIESIPTSNNPVELRRPMETLLTGRYSPHSVKKDGSPYSVREALEDILKSLSPDLLMNIQFQNFDNTVIVDNLIYDNINAVNVIRELLSQCRMGMTVTMDGIIYLYSLLSYEDKDGGDIIEKLKDGQFVVSGRLFKTNKRHARPQRAKIMFEKKLETLLVATEETRPWVQKLVQFNEPLKPYDPWEGQVFDNTYVAQRRVIACINVVPNPFPFTYNGREVNVGEFIPFSLFMTAYNIPAGFFQLPGYFSDTLEYRLIYHYIDSLPTVIKLGDYPVYALAGRLVEVIREHYQKTYMIDPYWMGQIKSWDASMSSVINNYDRKSPPSMVYSDYTLITYQRTPELHKATPSFFTNNFVFTAHAPIYEHPAPFGIVISNKQLGVFHIDTQQPYDLTVARVIPHRLNTTPIPAAGQDTILLDQTYPLSSFIFSVVVSIVWRTDNEQKVTNKKYFCVQANNDGQMKMNNDGSISDLKAGANSEFPEWVIYSTYDYARYRFFEKALKTYELIDPITQKKLISTSLEAPPLNAQFLVISAKYEAVMLYTLFQDRYTGKIQIAGLETNITLAGNAAHITWFVLPAGFSTVVTFLDNIPFPSEVIFFQQREIDFIRSQINRAGEITYQHTT